MLTALVSLFTGGLGGGIMALLTGVLKFFQAKHESDHEYRMSKLQLSIDKARAVQKIDLVHAQGDEAERSKQMDALMEAYKDQDAPSGIAWVDALNKSVRPILTYWWLVLFTVYKIGTLIILIHDSASIQQFVANMWTQRDWEVFGTIVGFWFVNRTLWRHEDRQ